MSSILNTPGLAGTAHAHVAPLSQRLSYAVVWRWHFYAGLFCIPFFLWLATTGSIYLFKPEIDAFLDRPYDSLGLYGELAPPSAQIKAALGAVDHASLYAYELPPQADAAARVLLSRGDDLIRVYVHPQTLEILKVIPENDRFTRMLFYLHGELLLGTPGSMAVELAASWGVVMILTGLYLWWPRQTSGLGGVLYPRLDTAGRPFWREIHAVLGFWVAAFTLFLLITGLPWAASWGAMLKSVRQFGSIVAIHQDWTTGSASEVAERRANAAPPASHAEHHHHAGALLNDAQWAQLDRVVPAALALDMAAPVLIAPPSERTPHWSARSEAQNRPLREKATFDDDSGALLSRERFSQWPLLDRLVGYGVAIHEGQMFGWLNQALGLFTAASLIGVAVSGFVMWLKRKPTGKLGAPGARRGLRPTLALAATIGALAVALPLLGASMLLVLALERWLLSRIPAVARFLGVAPA